MCVFVVLENRVCKLHIDHCKFVHPASRTPCAPIILHGEPRVRPALWAVARVCVGPMHLVRPACDQANGEQQANSSTPNDTSNDDNNDKDDGGVVFLPLIWLAVPTPFVCTPHPHTLLAHTHSSHTHTHVHVFFVFVV